MTLADRSEELARVLNTGDDCRALALAEQLRVRTIAAINTGRVPAVFQEPLLDRVNSLATRIRCVPPAPVDKKGKDHGKKDDDKGKKKGHKGDD